MEIEKAGEIAQTIADQIIRMNVTRPGFQPYFQGGLWILDEANDWWLQSFNGKLTIHYRYAERHPEQIRRLHLFMSRIWKD